MDATRDIDAAIHFRLSVCHTPVLSQNG